MRVQWKPRNWHFQLRWLQWFISVINKYFSPGTLDNSSAFVRCKLVLKTCDRICSIHGGWLSKACKHYNMAFYNLVLLGLFLICQHIRYVMAASECTTAIVASVFGTIGGLLFIAAIVALVWYCCRQRDSSTKLHIFLWQSKISKRFQCEDHLVPLLVKGH